MGINYAKMANNPQINYTPVNKFQFHNTLEEDTSNGLYFCEIYLPEEIVMLILSYIDPREILTASLVCRKWCNIIKSPLLWSTIYTRHYSKKAKKLPWYVYYCLFTTNYFDTNLVKNGNGENGFKQWKIIKNYGDEFKIEDPPAGADPLPLEVIDFNGHKSCFATSFYECNKLQEISLKKNRLLLFIINKFKPHIYASEWVAARFDCGCVYVLTCKLLPEEHLSVPVRPSSSTSEDDEYSIVEPLLVKQQKLRIEQWAGSTWIKVEILMKDYPEGVARIIFQHEGHDTQFWKGHYGSKMAGGVVKILFDSIE